MAKSVLLNSIADLSNLIDSILDERDKLLIKVNELQKENSNLRNELEQNSQLLNNTLKDVEFLRLSHRLAVSPEALTEARKEISRLIRTIDSCIQLLRED